MAKSAFAFRLGERVNVPGYPGAQGVIGLPNAGSQLAPENLPDVELQELLWFVRWVAGDGMMKAGWWCESDLLAANIPPQTPSTTEEIINAKSASVKAARVYSRKSKSKSKKRK